MIFKKLKNRIHKWTTDDAPKKEIVPKNKIVPQDLMEKFEHLRVINNAKETLNFEELVTRIFQKTVKDFFVPTKPNKEILNAKEKAIAMDSWGAKEVSNFYLLPRNTLSSGLQFQWFAQHSFIGHQMCAVLAQHWLIDKVCTMPAEDAVRNQFEITLNNTQTADPKIIDSIRQANKKYKLTHNMVQFVRMGRIFGIRIAMFVIDFNDSKKNDEFYLKEFNIDAIIPNSYKGISQIDPFWITPELDGPAATDPTSIGFYEPTHWRVAGIRIHKSHLVIMRNGEVADVLKPSYYYGGVPIPQKIYNRIYAAERTADEAPLLALAKRTLIYGINLEEAVAQPDKFISKFLQFAQDRNNWGGLTMDREDTVVQFDTSLSDLDAVIMSQYQIVAAIAGVPAVELLGTSPKGFNATGEFEEKSYRKSLQSIQTHYLTPLVERHHQLLMKSEISPDNSLEITIKWNSTSSLNEKDITELNKSKIDSAVALINAGVISQEEERRRLIAEETSGYNGLPDEIPEDEQTDLDEDEGAEGNGYRPFSNVPSQKVDPDEDNEEKE